MIASIPLPEPNTVAAFSISVIARIMGHDSLEQCMKYLGLDMDNMTRAMNKFALGIS